MFFTQGESITDGVPEDLQHFCESLDIPLIEVPELNAEFHPRTAQGLHNTEMNP